MSKLNDIRPRATILQIGFKTYYLVFNLQAFAYLEEAFGSIKEAIDFLNKRNLEAIKIFLNAGFLYLKQKVNVDRLMKIAETEALLVSLVKALDEAIGNELDMIEDWDWTLMYYFAKPVLNMTEKEFWNSTPKKLISMLKVHADIKGIKVEQKLKGIDAINEFMK